MNPRPGRKAAVKQPSAVQLSVLRRMAAADGSIRRLDGGFWISGTPAMKPNGSPLVPFGLTINDVWCELRTVRAMESRGWIERTDTFTEEWRDTRRITPAGRALIS